MLSIIAGLLLAVSPHDYCGGWFEPDCPASGTGDWSPIFEEMLASEECAPMHDLKQGCKVELKCHFDYRLSRPINVCRGVVFSGCGAGRDSANTWLSFDRSVENAVTFWPRTKCPYNPDAHWGSDGAALFGLGIRNIPTTTIASGTLAVRLYTAPKIEDVLVWGVGRGLLADCDVARKGTNCNTLNIRTTHIRALAGYGAWIKGDDANAGYALGLDVGSVCRYAAPWKQKPPGDPERTDPPCWGVKVDPFINFALYSPHVATIRRIDGTSWYPPYILSPTQKSSQVIAVAPYEEVQLPALSEIGLYSMTVGTGMTQLSGTMGARFGSKGKGLIEFSNLEKAGETATRLLLGDPAGKDTWMQLVSGGRQYFLRYDASLDSLVFAGQSPDQAPQTRIDAWGRLWVKDSSGWVMPR